MATVEARIHSQYIIQLCNSGRGFSVEKQCTTERGILNEVGGRKAADLLNAAIHDELACLDGFCVCSSAQCNRPSLAEQQVPAKFLTKTRISYMYMLFSSFKCSS